MKFETYLNQAWTDHATQSEKVAEQFSVAMNLVENNTQLNQLAGLVTHVMGEHLNRWSRGIEILQNLTKHPRFLSESETEKAILRSIQVLKIGGGQESIEGVFTTSDQIRILAVTATALSEKNTVKARAFLMNALELAKGGVSKEDPANRALAITGNNLACALEEKKTRNFEETELMILAANVGHKYWSIVGTWLEISRAEYRLAMSNLQAGDIQRAYEHAQICVELCVENRAGNMDMFYCYEVLATVEKVRQNELGFQKALGQVKNYFEKLNANDKSWCEPSLKKLLQAT